MGTGKKTYCTTLAEVMKLAKKGSYEFIWHRKKHTFLNSEGGPLCGFSWCLFESRVSGMQVLAQRVSSTSLFMNVKKVKSNMPTMMKVAEFMKEWEPS